MYENKPKNEEQSATISPTETPQNITEPSRKVSRGNKPPRVRSWILAVCIGAGAFLGGMLTRELMLDPELRSLQRLKESIQKNYYEEVSDEAFYKILFEAVNENVLDEYSWYMRGEEYKQSQTEAKGEQSGIGLVLRTQDASGNEQMLISRICGNSPAEAVGVKTGEYVTGFGKSETQLVSSEKFSEFSEFLGACETGEEFCLRLRFGADGDERIVRIAKSVYVENYVFYKTKTSAYRFTGNNALEMAEGNEPLSCLPDDTAYIRLVKFNGEAANEVAKAMERFQSDGKKNLVLDLRGNGGGYLDIMQEISRYFCKNATADKPVVAVADYGEKKTKFRATGNDYGKYFSADSRICVLADSETASASECLLGCMLDYATIAPTDICLTARGGVARTYGKGIMQTTYPYLTLAGDAVKLTTAKILWPITSKCIHGIGVLPSDGALTVEENSLWEQETQAALQTLFP